MRSWREGGILVLFFEIFATTAGGQRFQLPYGLAVTADGSVPGWTAFTQTELSGPDGRVSSDDGTYITVAANGEKIPHPASSTTYAVQDGATTVLVPEGMVYVPAGSFVMGNGATSH